MRIEWQVAVFCTLSCCFCGLITGSYSAISRQLDCSLLLTRVGFAHIYLEAWLRRSVMLQEICSSWLRCWLWLPGNRAILRKKKRRKTNVLSMQQITLPEEGESRDEWNPARTGCQEHQARLLQIWKKKSRINENYRSSCIRLVAIFEKV